MRPDLPFTPAGTLIRALGLPPRTSARIQDLYSRPILAIPVTRPEPAEELAAA
jgi:hypothetical protein